MPSACGISKLAQPVRRQEDALLSGVALVLADTALSRDALWRGFRFPPRCCRTGDSGIAGGAAGVAGASGVTPPTRIFASSCLRSLVVGMRGRRQRTTQRRHRAAVNVSVEARPQPSPPTPCWHLCDVSRVSCDNQYWFLSPSSPLRYCTNSHSNPSGSIM